MSITVSNLSFSYPGVDVLQRISFSIKEGDFVAVIGPNGSGKTTLMKLLLGFLTPTKGEITLFGHKLSEFKHWKWVGYVPQRLAIDKQFPGTVRELLEPHNHPKNEYKLLGVDRLYNQRFTELSGGQQQRVLIALALQSHPKLLILDEPAAGVDVKTVSAFYDTLKKLNEEFNITILLVTHDVGMIPQVCKSVLGINHKLICCEKAKDAKKLVKKIYGGHFDHNH